MNKRFRKLINDIHLWLGLGSGIILFVVCLTGTIYTFRTEIDEYLNKDTYFFEALPAVGLMNADDLVAAVSQSEKAAVTGFTIPSRADRYWTFSLKPVQTKKGSGNERGKQVLVNPYTGEVMGGIETGTGRFFQTVMKLHRWLLMEQKTGRIIVGIATIVFTFLLLSGLILWFPKKLRYWKQGFFILFSGKWKRINYDLHNVLGFYSFIVLLVMALTGLCWSFEWYKKGMSKILGAPVLQRGGGKPLESKIAPGNTVALSGVLKQGNEILPQKGTVRLTIPEDSTGVYVFTKNNQNAFNVTGTDRLSIDQYSGEIIKVEKFADKTFRQKIAASIKPLHTGEIYGWFSKIIYFISCLIATSLPVTGTFVWWNKRRKR